VVERRFAAKVRDRVEGGCSGLRVSGDFLSPSSGLG
jgi:hypothetical protein